MKTSIEDTIKVVSHFGLTPNRNHMFQMRSERTPSAKINKDGTIHDFGSGWHGDLLDFVQEIGQARGYLEAKELVSAILGRGLEQSSFVPPVQAAALKKPAISEDFLTAFKANAVKDQEKFTQLITTTFAGKVSGKKMPTCNIETAIRVANRLEIGLSPNGDRLIMPIKDLNGKVINLWKYKPSGTPKVLYTKGRKLFPLGLSALQKNQNFILLVEGEKDFLNATANGLIAITLGGVGNALGQHASLFSGHKVIIAYDYDEAGQEGARKRAEELKGIAKVTILNWAKKAQINGFELFDKFDLSDYLAWKHTKMGAVGRR